MSKIRGFLLWLLVVCTGVVFAQDIEVLSEPIPHHVPTLQENQIASLAISSFLEKRHYSGYAVTPSVCSTWFNEFFRSLDGNKIYFRQSDIEDFLSYEPVLWLETEHKANLEFPFKVMERYLERVREKVTFILQCLEQPMDFQVQEDYRFDRKDALRFQTQEEQHDYWRKILKNEVLDELLKAEKAAKKPQKKGKEPVKVKTFEEIKKEIAKFYLTFYRRRLELEPRDVLELYLSALCRTADPHSCYMAPVTKEDFDINMSLSLQGIGATLSEADFSIKIVELVPGGPAAKDGRLKKGDRILAVAQQGQEPVDVTSMKLRKAVQLIRGPKGTQVTLTIQQEGVSTTQNITLVRDEIKLENKAASSDIREVTLPDKTKARVLVMHLPAFYCDFAGMQAGRSDYRSTTKDMKALLETASKEKPLDGVIVDLRGNGGGSLEEVIRLTGLFLPKGPVVQIRERNGKVEVRRDDDATQQFAGPLIVMTDTFSASASEIFAAALQDHGRALIVGDKATHGKGTVQAMMPLSRPILPWLRTQQNNNENYGSIKLTIAKFYRINGGSTQVKGVTPDIIFPSFVECLETRECTLPFALPWDEIQPAVYQPYTNLKPILPVLQQNSLNRRKKNPLFQEYEKQIAHYRKFRDMKQIPLHIKQRRKYEQEQDKADEIFKRFRDLLLDSQKDDKAKPKPQDFVLDETLNIMGDYINATKK